MEGDTEDIKKNLPYTGPRKSNMDLESIGKNFPREFPSRFSRLLARNCVPFI
jgi:hypothetical protein